VKTHDVAPAHVFGKLPQVAVQLVIGALAVNCCVWFTVVVADAGVKFNGPIVAVVVADNVAGLGSVAVMVADPVELPAVKTHDCVFVHGVRKFPSPVAPQLTDAFAVKV
jgi:hypothetical protein